MTTCWRPWTKQAKDILRVLGIDTSLRSTGIAVVERTGNSYRAVVFDTVKIAAQQPHTECFRRILEKVGDMIASTGAEEASIEGAFFCKNAKTALILGEARGVAIVACAQKGLPVFEYAPRRVKQAIVGNGNAEKLQVRRMVMQLLSLREEPQEDAGDALALAICHLQSRSGHSALAPKSI